MLMGHLIPFRECKQRALNVLGALDCTVIPPEDHGMEPILSVHTRDYVEHLKMAYKQWVLHGGNPQGVMPDTFPVRLEGHYCFPPSSGKEGTYQAAYSAAQVAITGAERLAAERRVFALCRPPGHHAHCDIAGGYCFFNNAAIAAHHLIHRLNAGRVCILDIDYHHGNGTQSIFYELDNPLYCSLHGDVQHEYPYYWGRASETGHGKGKGFNVNVNLKKSTSDKDYLEALNATVDNHILPFKPDALVVSLGVDTFQHDPVGGLCLTQECYSDIGTAIARINVPTLFIMEGGYHLETIGENVARVLQQFKP